MDYLLSPYKIYTIIHTKQEKNARRPRPELKQASFELLTARQRNGEKAELRGDISSYNHPSSCAVDT